MKHSRAFISYFGYRALFWKAMLEHDGEKIEYYIKEMRNNVNKMDRCELLELLSIIDVFYSSRQ